MAVAAMATAQGALAQVALTPASRDALAGASSVSVMFGTRPGHEGRRRAPYAIGGLITRTLGIIDAQVAVLPAAAVRRLSGHPSVAWVAQDRSVRLSHASGGDPSAGPSSLFHIADTVRAKQVWGAGFSGAGVDVAVLESGVVPVDGLTAPGKVVDGPDLSFESGEEALRHLDTYGHGTHMAGVIAGRDDALPTPVREASHERFAGVAPDARIVNVKVADSSGATDVSQVIAGIDWVVQHGRSNGLNIRVLNLSFGTDGVQDYRLDPLAHAVEEAWRRGVVVVVAAGNEGYGDARMNNPAYDPYVLAVGGSDGRGTVGPDDDLVAGWSSRGDVARRPTWWPRAPGWSACGTRARGWTSSTRERASGSASSAAAAPRRPPP